MESIFAEVIAKYSEMVEAKLKLVGKDVKVDGSRVDLLFKDGDGKYVIVEVKDTPVSFDIFDQVLKYRFLFSKEKNIDPYDVRCMVISPSIRKEAREAAKSIKIEHKRMIFTDDVRKIPSGTFRKAAEEIAKRILSKKPSISTVYYFASIEEEKMKILPYSKKLDFTSETRDKAKKIGEKHDILVHLEPITFEINLETPARLVRELPSTKQGLSKTEVHLLSALAAEGKTIITLEDITSKLGCPYKNAKVISNRLVKKKWLILLTRGKYLISPLSAGVESKYTEHEFVIASHLVHPYYIGYWSALNHHGFTEQTPFTVFVVTTKRRAGREILNVRYKFVTVVKRKFFGLTKVAVANASVNISDKEKTLADCLDHPEFCGGITEVAKSLWNAREEISFEKLIDYSIKMGNKTILKRLGFLVELLEIPVPDETIERIHSRISEGYSSLDPVEKRGGNYDTRWNLLVNVPRDSLLEWKRGF